MPSIKGLIDEPCILSKQAYKKFCKFDTQIKQEGRGYIPSKIV